MKTLFIYLFPLMLFFGSCQSASDENNFLHTNTPSEKWQIAQFDESPQVSPTETFTASSFEFMDRGIVSIRDHTKIRYGKWHVKHDAGSDDLPASDYLLQLDFSTAPSLSALNGNWIILAHTQDELSLVRIDAKGKSNLVFKAVF